MKYISLLIHRERLDPEPKPAKMMCDVVRYRLEHTDFLQHQEYGEQLLQCFETV